MTGSDDTGTALCGALNFDVVVVWKSSRRQAESEMRNPKSELDVKNNISRGSPQLADAKYKGDFRNCIQQCLRVEAEPPEYTVFD